jgi:CRISPR system Cascade subunit CasE
MSFLTQILVPYELAARQLRIRDAYDWHQRVWQAFRGCEGKPRDFLSRVDEIDDAYRVLIVSPTSPVRPDWCPSDCYGVKEIPSDFFDKKRYRFSLLANPTRKVRGDAQGNRTKNGRRLPITKREDLLAWLSRKADAGGFSLVDPSTIRTVPRPRSYFHKKGHSGACHAVDFQGILEVGDPELFLKTFSTGVGSAKAFGFGLLAIAPSS